MALIKIQSSYTAWIRDDGYNYPEQNQLTTTGKASGYTFNSYYIYDVPSNIQNITSAELHFGVVYYASTDISEALAIYDVSTSISELTHNHTNSDYGLNPSIYLDMMNGSQYATGSLSNSQVGSDLNISLNSLAIDDLYLASGSQLAFGMTTTDSDGDYNQYFGFNSTGVTGYQELWITTVPLPSSIVFITSGILLLSTLIKRSKVTINN